MTRDPQQLFDSCMRDISASSYKLDLIIMNQKTLDALSDSQISLPTRPLPGHIQTIQGVEISIDPLMPDMTYRIFSKEQVERLSFKHDLGVIVL